MRDRPFRRHQKAKAKRRARRVSFAYPSVEKITDHLATCSGPCCGNPRKWFGEITRGEVRAAKSHREQVADLDQ